MHSFDPVGFVKVPTAHTEKYREKILIYYLIENVKEKGKKEGVRERKRKRERERTKERKRIDSRSGMGRRYPCPAWE